MPHHPLWLFTFSLLMSYVITLTSNAIGTETDPFLSFLLPVSDCFLLSLLAYALGKLRLHWIVSIAVVAILFAELFTVFFYHTNLTVYVVQLVLETNGSEGSEFIRAALTHRAIWYALAITAATAVIASALLPKKSEGHHTEKETGTRPTHSRLYKLSFTLLALLIAWSVVRQASAYYKLYCCFSSASTTVCNDTRYIPHLNTPFVRLGYGLAYNHAATAELNQLEHTVAATTVDSCNFSCPLIVLVIGESYNKHHTPLYNPGYLNTTPHLLQQQRQGNLVVFTDAVSPYNFTSNAFKYMFSTGDEDDGTPWVDHTLFPAVFKKAGYNVYFYTNQFAVSQTDNWNLAGGTIFNRTQLSRLQFSHRNQHVYQYDGQLLNALIDTLEASQRDGNTVGALTANNQKLKTEKDGTLIILHLIGQHVKYDHRYPPAFARFTAADETTPHGGTTGRTTAAHYDNALLYNDHVLNTLFGYLADKDAVAVILADHGEEVYDWRNTYERTNERNLSPEVARYQYEIPLMIYTTPAFRHLHNDVSEAIAASAQRPFTSTDLSHLMLYLGGIGHADYNEKRNILSPQYDRQRLRLLRNDVDYDKLVKTP